MGQARLTGFGIDGDLTGGGAVQPVGESGLDEAGARGAEVVRGLAESLQELGVEREAGRLFVFFHCELNGMQLSG